MRVDAEKHTGLRVHTLAISPYSRLGGDVVAHHGDALAKLHNAWTEAQAGRGAVVFVEGEAGVGKTRLIRALQGRLSSTPHNWFDCFCSPFATHAAFFPILELVRTSVGVTREDSNKERLHKLRGYLADTRLDKAEALPLLAAALAIPPDAGYLPPNLSPQAQRQRTLEVLASLLLRSSPLEPGLVVVEDLHWMDPSTLDLLQRAFGVATDLIARGLEADGFEPGPPEAFGGQHLFALETHPAATDHRQGQVGQRTKVPAGAHRSFFRHDRCYTGIEHICCKGVPQIMKAVTFFR